MDMHDPAHPGAVLSGWLDDLGLSVTDFARHVGISRVMLSRILHGHAVGSPTACRGARPGGEAGGLT